MPRSGCGWMVFAVGAKRSLIATLKSGCVGARVALRAPPGFGCFQDLEDFLGAAIGQQIASGGILCVSSATRKQSDSDMPGLILRSRLGSGQPPGCLSLLPIGLSPSPIPPKVRNLQQHGPIKTNDFFESRLGGIANPGYSKIISGHVVSNADRLRCDGECRIDRR